MSRLYGTGYDSFTFFLIDQDAIRCVVVYSGLNIDISATVPIQEWSPTFDLVESAFDCHVCISRE